MLFDTCDLDHEPIILVLKLDLDIMITYLNKVNIQNGSKDTVKCVLLNTCDLDFNLTTLVLQLDLDITVTFFYTKNEIKRLFGSKAIVWKHHRYNTFTTHAPRLRGFEF